MATARVNFYVLDVGQGSLNYVEVLDGNDKVTNNMIIDIGTDSSNTIAEANMEWLRKKIEGYTNPRIDVVVLTHGDTDHYNLILGLLPALKPADTGRIGMIRYGGDKEDYTVGSPLKILKAYCSDIKGFAPSSTGYDSSDVDPWADPIWTAGGVELRLLVANLPVLSKAGKPTKKPRADARKNTGSVIVGVYWDKYWYICTGDGTGTTLAGANDVFEGETGLPTTFLMTTPHHGSFKTTYNLSSTSATPSNIAIQVVDTFAGIFNPYTVSASAGEKNHHHASMFVVEQFSKYTKADRTYWRDDACGKDDRHFITTWADYHITAPAVTPPFPKYERYITTQTKKNVYTTHYFIDSPYNDTVSVPPSSSATHANKKAKTVLDYPYQYITPPEWAVKITSDSPAVGIPLGRNYTFYMTDKTIGMKSTTNSARTVMNSVAIVGAAAPPSFVAAASRTWRASMTPQPPSPALPRARPSLVPDYHPLKSLRAIQ
jgi:Metallo-beta-lactamase superfamily